MGLTEIRGPYYHPIGCNLLQDVLETCGHAIDGFKFAGGSFSVMPKANLMKLLDLCHHNSV